MNAVLRVLHDLTAGPSGYEPMFLTRLVEQAQPLSEEDVVAGVRELAWNEIIEVVKIGLGRRLRIVLPPEQVLARLVAGDEAAFLASALPPASSSSISALVPTASRLRLVEPDLAAAGRQSFGTASALREPQSGPIHGERSGPIYESVEDYAADVRAWELGQRDET